MAVVDDPKAGTNPLKSPCGKQFEAYQKALAEAVEARQKAEPFMGGQKGDPAGDWILTRALEAQQKADDAFKVWRDCVRAHPLP